MGIVQNISHDKFPKQGKLLNQRVRVCFNYDTSHILEGTMVRDDLEAPFEGLIALDNGTYIRAVECQFQPI